MRRLGRVFFFLFSLDFGCETVFHAGHSMLWTSGLTEPREEPLTCSAKNEIRDVVEDAGGDAGCQHRRSAGRDTLGVVCGPLSAGAANHAQHSPHLLFD